MRTVVVGAVMLVLGFVLGWGLRGQPPAEDRHLQRAAEAPAPAPSPPVQESAQAASSRPEAPVEAVPAASKPPTRHRESMTVQPAAPSPPPPVQEEPTWHRVASFSGSSAKNTETFYVPGGQWRLRWEGQPDNEYGFMVLQIFVNRADGSMVGLGANTNTPGSDVSYFHEGGSFWMQINSAGCRYSLTAESLH